MVSYTRTSVIRSAPIIQLFSEVTLPDDTLSLGQGIPFFGPPKKSIKALNQFASDKKGYMYSADSGLLSLRKSVQQKIEGENEFTVNENQIIITAGANQGFMTVILSISQPGDEFIIITPTYFNYVMAIQLAGCKSLFVSTNPDTYLPKINDIEHQITKKTKAIITISPNNPTGTVYPKNLLEKINRLCQDKKIYHISDEVYEYYIYDDHKHISPAIFDESLNHTISLFSCSKSFGMSGYRIGCVVAPKMIIDDLVKVQDTIGICAPVPCQHAAIHAFKLGKSYINQFYSNIDATRRFFFKKLTNITGVTCPIAQGAMYFFIRLPNQINPWDLAKMLIEQYKVITIPGSVFDTDIPSLRISFGNLPLNESKKAIHRLHQGLTDLL